MVKTQRSNRSNDADKWLNYFTALVDYRRLQRGVTLFHEDAIHHFEWTSTGYTALVQGSAPAPYRLNADMQIISKFPDLQTYTVHCECPDQARYCKHAVCTTLHAIVLLDKMLPHLLHQTSINISYKGERLIKQIEEFAKRTPHRVSSLYNHQNQFDTYSQLNDTMRTIHQHLHFFSVNSPTSK